MQTIEPHHNPETILKTGTGFWASKILLSAVNFSLFTLIAEKKKMNATQIKKALGLQCSDRNVYDFLDALFTFGFLSREGLLETAWYSNSPDSDFFLDKNKPTYIGGILEMMNNRLYGFWANLEEGLRTGLPQNEIKGGSESPFAELYKTPERLEGFVNAMSGIQMGNFTAFAQKFDFSKYNSLVDMGGAAGLLSIMVAKHNPGMDCTSMDLPPVEPIAKATIEKFKLSDRVKTGSTDFFADPFPRADVIVMGNILHDWDESKKRELLGKAFEALPQGGAFVAIENIIDDQRKENVFGMMMSLNMLIETGTGFDYTFADFRGWVADAGFSSSLLIPLAGPASAAVAYK